MRISGNNPLLNDSSLEIESDKNLKQIPINMTGLFPHRDRRPEKYTEPYLSDILPSMREDGEVKVPVIAVRTDGYENYDKLSDDLKQKDFIVIAGGRRLSAAKILEWDYIDAIVYEELPVAELYKIMETENEKRKSRTYCEGCLFYYQAFTEILEVNPSYTKSEFAKSIDKKLPYISKVLGVAEVLLSPPVRKIFGDVLLDTLTSRKADDLRSLYVDNKDKIYNISVTSEKLESINIHSSFDQKLKKLIELLDLESPALNLKAGDSYKIDSKKGGAWLFFSNDELNGKADALKKKLTILKAQVKEVNAKLKK